MRQGSLQLFPARYRDKDAGANSLLGRGAQSFGKFCKHEGAQSTTYPRHGESLFVYVASGLFIIALIGGIERIELKSPLTELGR